MTSFKSRAGASLVASIVVVGIAALLFIPIYLVRPLAIFHDTTWFLFVKYPIIWLIPTLVGLVFAAVIGYPLYQKRKPQFTQSRDRYSYGLSPKGKFYRAVAIAFFVPGLIAFIPCALLAKDFTMRSVYQHYKYVQISKLPKGGEVRLVPQVVADKEASIGYNLSGHQLGDGHIVLDPRTHRLTWMFEQQPSSWFNRLKRNTEGVAMLDAQETSRTFKEIDKTFKRAPEMHISDNTRWYILKKDYYSVTTPAVPVVTKSGEPEFIVPTLSYKGFLIKYPVLSRVYIFHADGRVESLTPAQAAERSDVANTGRLIPQDLARQIQDAYAYKHGISNVWFGHTDQTQIADSEQPYLMAFKQNADGTPLAKGVSEKLYWVSSAEPHGRAYATNAIFLTDAITGTTYVWRVPRDTSLVGPGQALQTAKSLAIPGITWATDGDKGSSGRYETVEPRPVFVKGRLQYLISVVPTSFNNVTMSVIVDAATNKVVAVFNHDTEFNGDVNADKKLVAYLRTGVLDESASATSTDVGQPNGAAGGNQGTSTPTAPGAPTVTVPVTGDVKQLIEENNQLLKQVTANQARIEQLLSKQGKK